LKSFFLFVFFVVLFLNAQPEEHSFVHGGLTRIYYLYIPESLEVGSPLLFVLHGYSGSAYEIMDYTNLNQISEEHRFAVCYPQGIADDWNYNFWNVGYDFHSNETVDDVLFITALAQYLQTEYQLSSYNTFSTGMSNGGDMSYLLACQASDVFRAIAPVAGCMMSWIYDSCDPQRPLPVFEIHGTDDNVTWWNGANENNNDGWGPWESVDTTFTFWTQINNCTIFNSDTLPNTNSSDGSYIISHKNSGGAIGNEVWLYEVVNGGHDWPGAWGNMDISASLAIWEFFREFITETGDINIDQTINILDLLLLSDLITNGQEYNSLYDCNLDNDLDIYDVYTLATHILGHQ